MAAVDHEGKAKKRKSPMDSDDADALVPDTKRGPHRRYALGH